MNPATFFDVLQRHFDDALPWVAYRKPNETRLNAFLQENDVLYEVADFTESGFVFAPFDTSEGSTVLIPFENSVIINSSENQQTLQENAVNRGSDPSQRKSTSNEKEDHVKLVNAGLQKIKQGVLKKVVLSRKQKIPITKESPLAIFKRLLDTYSTAFVYCWYHPKVGLWLGATPETLLSLDHHKLKTMSLAGTQQYLGTLEVRWGIKEIEEQQLVTDSIVENLAPLVGDITVTPVQTQKAGTLLHLNTKIEADFDKTVLNLRQVIAALHPTPAVCGLPKKEAKKFIITSETYNRSYYTGFLGELNLPKQKRRSSNRRNVENLAYRVVTRYSHLYVNLRCMEIDASGAQLYVGGGITSGSIPEAEWEETVNKLETMSAVLKEQS